MFRHILVPTDLTEKSERATQIAVKIAAHDSSKVTLLHVIEIIEDTDCDQFNEFYHKLGRRAQRKMDKIISQYGDSPLAIEREVVYGRRAKAIVDFAEDREVDLIVMSSHRIDKENPSLGWGSISHKVGILAQCPVMLVK